MLRLCLERLQELHVESSDVEILVYDNGAPHDSRSVVDSFAEKLPFLEYCLNEAGHGLGYSLCRGAADAKGQYVVELNDDALVPADFLNRINSIFASDPSIGVVGVRAIEKGYITDDRPIGSIDSKTAEVAGNFNQETDGVIDVEHVYGFCYGYRRELLELRGGHDRTLLSRDFSSGSRIETDHCLTAKRLGYRVVYDGRIAVPHLAKPRPDIDETSLRWKLDHWRNTLYLFLKHFGWFGRDAIAIRFALVDLGLISFLRRPNKTNWLYLWAGICARTSAVWHWIKFLLTSHNLKAKHLNKASRV